MAERKQAARYVALQHLKWGDKQIAPGEDVPDGDRHRDYAAMIRNGQIKDLGAPGKVVADAEALARVEAKLDAIMGKLGVEMPSEPEPEPAAESDKGEATDGQGDGGSEGDAGQDGEAESTDDLGGGDSEAAETQRRGPGRPRKKAQD